MEFGSLRGEGLANELEVGDFAEVPASAEEADSAVFDGDGVGGGVAGEGQLEGWRREAPVIVEVDFGAQAGDDEEGGGKDDEGG